MANVVEIVLRSVDESATRGIDALKESIAGGGGLTGAMAALGPVAAVAATAIGSAFALEGAISKVDELGSSVFNMQKKLGDSAENISRLHFALQETGTDADTAVRGFDIMAKGIDTGSKTVSSALDTLGVAGRDASGNIRPMNDLLLDVAEKFKTMPDGPQKTALAMELFGRSGAALIPFLDRGRDGIAELEKESDKLGTTMSGSTLDAVRQNTIAQREFDAALEGLQIQIGTLLLPVLTKLMELAVNLAVAFNEHVMPAIKALGPYIQEAVDWFTRLTNLFQKDPFAALSQGLKDVITGWATFELNLYGKIGEFAITLGQKLLEAGKAFVEWIAPQIPPMLDELGNLLGRFGDWITAPETLDMINAKLGEWGKAFIQWIRDDYGPFLAELAKILDQFGEWALTTAVPFIIEKTAQFAIAFNVWIVTKAIPAMLEELAKLDIAFAEWVVGTAVPYIGNQMVQVGTALVQGIWNGIQNAWGGLISGLQQKISELPEAAKKFLGISSPSTVFAEQVGVPISQGIAQGITDGASSIYAAITQVVQKANADAQAAIAAAIASNPTANTWANANQGIGSFWNNPQMQGANPRSGTGTTLSGGPGSSGGNATAVVLGGGGFLPNALYSNNAGTAVPDTTGSGAQTGYGWQPGGYNPPPGSVFFGGQWISLQDYYAYLGVPGFHYTGAALPAGMAAQVIAQIAAAAMNGQLSNYTAGPAPLGV